MTTKAQFINALAGKLGITKTGAAAVLNAVGEVLVEGLTEQGKAAIPGLGKLKVKVRSARVGRNPRTGSQVQIPERNVVKFAASKRLKEKV